MGVEPTFPDYLEVSTGFKPMITGLQPAALIAWLTDQILVTAEGFEPPKASPPGLQPGPVDRLGNTVEIGATAG